MSLLHEAPPKRSVAAYLILSFVTCGLFAIYWAYTISSDAAALRRTHGLPPAKNEHNLLLTLLTCGIYWFFTAGDDVDDLERRIGGKAEPSNWGLIYLVMCFLGLAPAAIILMQVQLNSLITKGAAHSLSKSVAAQTSEQRRAFQETVRQAKALHAELKGTGTSPSQVQRPGQMPAQMPDLPEEGFRTAGGGIPEFHDDGFGGLEDDGGDVWDTYSAGGASQESNDSASAWDSPQETSPDTSERRPSASDPGDIDWEQYGLKRPDLGISGRSLFGDDDSGDGFGRR